MYPLVLDPRTGSGDLAEPLRTLGVPVEVTQMEYGDVAILGRGPEGRPVSIGVEIKALGDLLRCITDKRYTSEQLPGLKQSYEIVYLVVEGMFTCSPNGELLVFKYGKWGPVSFGERPWKYEAVQSWLFGQEAITRVAFTADRRGTAAWIASLWRRWNLKAWEEHKSHLGLYWKPLNASGDEVNPLAELEITDETRKRIRAIAGLMDGIGYEKAKAAARHFPSVIAAVNADQAAWREVPGFGPTLAKKITEAVRKEG